MTKYSIDGYINDLEIRGRPVIFVEGASDSQIVGRVLIEMAHRGQIASDSVLVDDAELVESEPGVIGNGNIVRAVFSKSRGSRIPLAALCDREFEDFSTDGVITDARGCHHIQDDVLVQTRGHSIENYFFDSEYICNILKFLWGTDINGDMLALVNREFSEMLILAASASLAARDVQIISKICKIFAVDMFSFSGAKFSLDEALVRQEMLTRGVDGLQVDSFFREFNKYKNMSLESNCNTLQWVSHGHIGENVIWALIGALAIHTGVPRHLAIQISNGETKNKIRCNGQRWANGILSGSDIESPSELWQWARGVAVPTTQSPPP